MARVGIEADPGAAIVRHSDNLAEDAARIAILHEHFLSRRHSTQSHTISLVRSVIYLISLPIHVHPRRTLLSAPRIGPLGPHHRLHQHPDGK